jgi:chromosome segregation ATPase
MSRTSHSAEANSQTPDNLSAQLRAAEQRIRELEAKVRHLEDRADRAERWVYKIWVEIEQKFFGGDAVRFSQPQTLPGGD